MSDAVRTGSPAPAGSAFVAWDPQSEQHNADVADRQALRRVAGLRTDLADVSEVEYRQLRLEKVVLVGVWTHGSGEDAQQSMQELAALASTAGSQVMEGLIQRRVKPDPSTYIGKGKADQLRQVVMETGADTVICDGELTPGQLIALEKVVKVKVIDRTALILDIFAQHAKSSEGKAQVALAQMQYMLPRLRGWGESMSRQAGGRVAGGGGIGTRGPGETKIETDRRRIRSRMAALRRQVRQMQAARQVRRASRHHNQVPSVAIVGYTNAGKSSLLNRLTDAGVLVENALFATLDPTVRRTRTQQGREYTLADTVGFVRHLPHQLVDAFASTLEEAAHADLLVHVVDASHPDPLAQWSTVRQVLADTGAADLPELVALNKADLLTDDQRDSLLRRLPGSVAVSARTGQGIDHLRAQVESRLPEPAVPISVLIPFTQGGLVARIHAEGVVVSQQHSADGTVVQAQVGPVLAAALQQYRQ